MRFRSILQGIAARLDAEIAVETARIDADVAAKQIRDGTGYWQKRWLLQRRLDVVRAMMEAAE